MREGPFFCCNLADPGRPTAGRLGLDLRCCYRVGANPTTFLGRGSPEVPITAGTDPRKWAFPVRPRAS